MLKERNLLKQTPIIAKNYKYRTWLSFLDNKTAIEFDNIYFNSEIEIEIEFIVDNITNNIEHLISLSDGTPLIRFEKNAGKKSNSSVSPLLIISLFILQVVVMLLGSLPK